MYFAPRYSRSDRVAPWLRWRVTLRQALASCWLAFGLARAQSVPPVTLDLGVDVAGRGAAVAVPVTFATTDPHPVGKISLEVSFPKALLSFRGAVATTTEFKVETELHPSEGGGKDDVVRIEVTSPGAISPGELLKLSFEISKEAKLNDEIVIKNLAQEVRTLQGEAIAARGADGMVTVLEGAFFSCFFYMH